MSGAMSAAPGSGPMGMEQQAMMQERMRQMMMMQGGIPFGNVMSMQALAQMQQQHAQVGHGQAGPPTSGALPRAEGRSTPSGSEQVPGGEQPSQQPPQWAMPGLSIQQLAMLGMVHPGMMGYPQGWPGPGQSLPPGLGVAGGDAPKDGDPGGAAPYQGKNGAGSQGGFGGGEGQGNRAAPSLVDAVSGSGGGMPMPAYLMAQPGTFGPGGIMLHPGMRGNSAPLSPPPPQQKQATASGLPQEEGRQWQGPNVDNVGSAPRAQDAQQVAAAGSAKA